MIDMEGNRTDEFDLFLKHEVEDPATPALKKLATGEILDPNERSAIALFIALTEARSPNSMNCVLAQHLGGLDSMAQLELDALVKQWCGWTRRPYDSKRHGESQSPAVLCSLVVVKKPPATAAPMGLASHPNDKGAIFRHERPTGFC